MIDAGPAESDEFAMFLEAAALNIAQRNFAKHLPKGDDHGAFEAAPGSDAIASWACNKAHVERLHPTGPQDIFGTIRYAALPATRASPFLVVPI